MDFDAAVVFVTKFSLLFKLAHGHTVDFKLKKKIKLTMILFFQVFDGKTDTENMVKIFCGSVAESVTSTTNVVYVRFYSEKNGLESRFDSIFTAMRALDSGVIADSCDPEVSFFSRKDPVFFLIFCYCFTSYFLLFVLFLSKQTFFRQNGQV